MAWHLEKPKMFPPFSSEYEELNLEFFLLLFNFQVTTIMKIPAQKIQFIK